MGRQLLCVVVVCACTTRDPIDPEHRPGHEPHGTTGGPPSEPDPCTDVLVSQAQTVMGTRCSQCHGPDSDAYSGFHDALDPAALVEDGWVVPRHAATSKLMVEVSVGPNGEAPRMPIRTGPLTPTETGVLERWIDCGAEPWPYDRTNPTEGGPETRGTLVPEVEFEAAYDDAALLHVVDESGPDQRNARYLSLAPLYNAGASADQIELYASALDKLAWSLSTARHPRPLVRVQLDGLRLRDGSEIQVAEGLGDKLLFRLDEQDLRWEGTSIDVWEELMKAYPFGVRYDDHLDAARDLVAITHTRVPVAHADWFVARASRPPLYFDALDVPTTVDAFFQQFGGIDRNADFDANAVDCAGMNADASLLSNFDRVQCRHQALRGYCWETYDFGRAGGKANLFAFPTDFRTASAGGEAFCALPDGMQAYFVYDAAGNRLDDAPTDLVTDYNPDSDRVLHTGVSCLHCHESGVIERSDQVLDTVLATPDAFGSAVVDQVREWYPPKDDWAFLYDRDLHQFGAALDRIGADPETEEPIWALSRDYEAPVTVERAAAEFGLFPAELTAKIAVDDELQRAYSGLLTGGAIDRTALESVARQTICALQLGDACDEAAFCGASSAPCPAGSTCDASGSCTKVP